MSNYQYFAQGERLKNIRKKLGLSRKEVALSFEVSENFYGTLEMGRTIPTSGLLFMLANKYNVNINYVINGIGDPFITDVSNLQEKYASQSNSDYDAKITKLEREIELLKELVLLKK